MIRVLICFSFALAGLLAHAEDPREAPKTEKELTPTESTVGDASASTEKKSIFESQTKEDVEKMNQIDKSLYEVSDQAHPNEE